MFWMKTGRICVFPVSTDPLLLSKDTHFVSRSCYPDCLRRVKQCSLVITFAFFMRCLIAGSAEAWPVPTLPIRRGTAPESQSEPVKDHHVIFYVYTRPVDGADRFFRILKSLLKKEGLQDEVLVEKIPVWLLGDANGED
jgi:hypothetical protein